MNKNVLIGIFATLVGGMAVKTVQVMIKNKKEGTKEAE